MNNPRELEFSFGWQESPTQGNAYLEITPEAVSVKDVLYEVVRQSVRTASIGHALPGEDTSALISDESIARLLRGINFSEDGQKVEKVNGQPISEIESGRLLDLAGSDSLKFAVGMVDRKILFNQRLFDMNHGQGSSTHVMRTAMMALDIRLASVR